MLVSIISVQAVVKVAYITFQKTMDASGTTVQNDPIIQMLSADPKLAVTVKVLTAVAVTDAISDLSTYDVIIVQESFAGGAGMLMPNGALALKSIPKPFIYNKTYALNAQTGAFMWSYQANGNIYSSPTVANGILFFGSDDHNVYAVGAQSSSNSSVPNLVYYAIIVAVLIVVIAVAIVVLRRRR